MDFSQYLRQHLLFISDKRLLSGMSPALPAILPYIQYNIENSAKAIFLQMVLYLLDFVYTDHPKQDILYIFLLKNIRVFSCVQKSEMVWLRLIDCLSYWFT